MDSLTGGNPTNNPTNNPRLDLLHGTGVNSQVNAPANNTFSATAFHASPLAAAGAPAGMAGATASGAERPEYVKAAKTKPKETAPPPPPKPTPVAPEPRPLPVAPPPPRRKWPLIVGIILFVLFLVGAGIGWWLLSQQPQEEAPVAQKEVEVANPTKLRQVTEDGQEVTAGATTAKTSLTFRFAVASDANSGSLTPEIELRASDTPFTGEATASGEAVSANGKDLEFSVPASALANGSYHWQARVSKGDQSSEWVLFGNESGDANVQATTPSFVIDTAAAATEAPKTQPLTIETVSGVAVASPTVVTTAKPTFAGKSAAGATITLKIATEDIEQTAKANDQGSWSLAITKELASGTYQAALTDGNGGQAQVAVQVNVTTAAATPPPAATQAPAPAAPAATTTPSVPQTETLAATGDNTLIVSAVSFLVLLLAAAGFIWNRRRDLIH